jgi:hypothetical protein
MTSKVTTLLRAPVVVIPRDAQHRVRAADRVGQVNRTALLAFSNDPLVGDSGDSNGCRIQVCLESIRFESSALCPCVRPCTLRRACARDHVNRDAADHNRVSVQPLQCHIDVVAACRRRTTNTLCNWRIRADRSRRSGGVDSIALCVVGPRILPGGSPHRVGKGQVIALIASGVGPIEAARAGSPTRGSR